MDIKLPDKVKYIITKIEDAGYEAYAVGGCVRDSVIGRTPDDWDITTSAEPRQVKALFRRTVDTGIRHGTVTVMLEKEGFEVTTYRIDGEYEDGRHPKEVIFTGRLEEDLRRRDFTINAMAYNERSGLVDLFGGAEDIRNRTVRCVGKAEERFDEDALRMMRAVRFSAQLGYSIEAGTAAAIKKMAGNLKKISAERIRTELVKLLVSPHPDHLRICYETGITKMVLPEFDRCMETVQNNPHHCYTVGEHILQSMRKVRCDKVLRLTMLMHDIGKPETKTTDGEGTDHFHGHAAVSAEIVENVFRRLKFDNDTLRTVERLVLYHDYDINPAPGGVRRAVHKIGEDIFSLLFEVKRADMLAQSEYQREEKENRLEQVKAVYEEVIRQRDCVSLRTLAVTGKDLMDAGMKPGKEIGQVLDKLLEAVLENPEKNTKEELLKLYEYFL
jgi:uncharacterized domain HDIG